MNYQLLIILLLLPFSSLAATRQQVQEMIKAHDYQRVLPVLRQMMEQGANKRDADMNKWYGQTLCMTGSYAESLPYLAVGAKAGKIGAWWYIGISKQHLWDYDGAIEALETYRSKCSETSGWIPRTDSIIAECKLGQRAVQRVQDVVIIDSMQVAEQLFWLNYRMGAESGRLLDDGTFENQPGDCRIWAARDTISGRNMLWQSHAFQGAWEKPQPIPSVSSERYQICYPWQRTDGETLYFACDSTPGLGGLDIYMTTYDADNEAYRAPQRLGMPFNSPYNDYMLAIDEEHQVGWWATDRGAQPGMVQIFLFLVDEEPEYLDEAQPERARITSIAETWREEGGYATLVNTIRKAPQEAVVKGGLSIPIDDHTIYTSVDDFRTAEGRSLYQQAVALYAELAEAEERIEELRIRYHQADAAHIKALRVQILSLERTMQETREKIAEKEKGYRNREIK